MELHKHIDVRANQVSEMALRAMLYRCIPVINITDLEQEQGELVLKKCYLFHLSTTTGDNIAISNDMEALFGEEDMFELNKYLVRFLFTADVSTDAQGSGTYRMGFTNLAGNHSSYRPTWYGGGGVYAKNEIAGAYTQFSGGIWTLVNKDVTQLLFNFADWNIGETHKGILRVELWKLDLAVVYDVKSS